VTTKSRKTVASAASTPVRKSLKSGSFLLPLVQSGLGGLTSIDKDRIEAGLRSQFADSLDLDAAMRKAHPHDNRWDYLLGHAPTDSVVALEPHSANTSEVSVVIKKKESAQQHLKGHLKAGAKVRKWIWVASGATHILQFSKAKTQLAQSGITLAGKQVLASHL
jgi:hypothetical protein